jgi:hypothetical protein
MPSNEGLRMLVRQSPLTVEEWYTLIELRRQRMKPFLDMFTLPELGALKCLKMESGLHGLGDRLIATVGDERFSLKTQGIFCSQPRSAVDRVKNSGYREGFGGINVPDGTMRVWGLIRSGHWVLVTIDFVGEPGYKDRGYERATGVDIVESSLPAILEWTKENPEEILRALGQVIKTWTERRREMYEQMEALAFSVRADEMILSLIDERVRLSE